MGLQKITQLAGQADVTDHCTFTITREYIRHIIIFCSFKKQGLATGTVVITKEICVYLTVSTPVIRKYCMLGISANN
ncbi:hypothetical protein V1478_004834 [Vespula squamosa]|uniref:Uncharacterized protein n=1 Tax=Vespula squamosa TaxID=30214 RepID=A0ABD2BEV5_VESSQ